MLLLPSNTERTVPACGWMANGVINIMVNIMVNIIKIDTNNI